MSQPAIVTCALTGVLTNPTQHPVPVTPKEMALETRRAYDAGASIVHIHFRQQAEGLGHLPSWEPEIATAITQAIRDEVPDIIINMSTGVLGADISGPLSCLAATKPEYAACNAGSMNYLKLRSNKSWAWPPMLFDNPVEKIEAYAKAMKEVGTRPEFECFDTGHIRSVHMFHQSGLTEAPSFNFVMGIASGMPLEPEWLPLLLKLKTPNAPWQVTAIGRAEVWPVHRKAASLGGNLRTGLEDTFYLPSGDKASSNGELVQSLVTMAEEEGRIIASPEQARTRLNLR